MASGLTSFCTHTYRTWNGSASEYSGATCPYTGTGHFDRTGKKTDAAHDQCSKTVAGCRIRFPNAILPIAAFPEIAE